MTCEACISWRGLQVGGKAQIVDFAGRLDRRDLRFSYREHRSVWRRDEKDLGWLGQLALQGVQRAKARIRTLEIRGPKEPKIRTSWSDCRFIQTHSLGGLR